MSPEEKSYFSERAAVERQRAAESSNPHVVEIHEKLAALYEQLIESDEPRAPMPNGADATTAPHA